MDATEIKLPTAPKNPVQIALERSQLDLDNNPVDHRVPGRKTFNILYGSRRTGKTVLLSYLIKNFYLKRGLFSAVIILSPSKYDKAWNNIRSRKRVTIMNKCTDALLFDLLEQQEELVANGITRHILLCIDDYASQGKGLKALQEIAIRGRHCNLTVFVTSQYSRLLAPAIRQNAQGVIIFRSSDKELENLANEGLRTLLDVQTFIDFVKKHTITPRSFVYINLQSDNTYRIGFSE